jgi:hypothetical protein
MPYRLLCTATAAPNDYIELGTSSEALGELGYMDMLGAFFKNDEGSDRADVLRNEMAFQAARRAPFWRWLCSWARALRKPSDLGFDDGRFVLPPLTTRVTSSPSTAAGRLSIHRAGVEPARATQGARATLRERCEAVAGAATGRGSVCRVVSPERRSRLAREV